MESATYLFRERKKTHNDDFRHAESRWSALAQMVFIWMSKEGGKYLNVYRSIYNSNPEKWLTKNDESPQLNLNHWTALNSIVDGQIQELFPKEPRFSIKKPDITLINQSKDNTHITMIEVKTVGASVKDNVNNYQETVKEINTIDGYTCDLYYLMSYGHEDSPKDWKLLEGVKANIILWEELFLKMQNDRCPLQDYIPLENIDSNYWQEYIENRFQ